MTKQTELTSRINLLEKQIQRTGNYLQKQLVKKDYHWVGVYSDQLKDMCYEIEILKSLEQNND